MSSTGASLRSSNIRLTSFFSLDTKFIDAYLMPRSWTKTFRAGVAEWLGGGLQTT